METLLLSTRLAAKLLFDSLFLQNTATKFAVEKASLRASKIPLTTCVIEWVLDVTSFMWVMPRFRKVVANLLALSVARDLPEARWLVVAHEERVRSLSPQKSTED